MKLVILAGGKGTRGKPFTEYFPKAMIPIEGRPLIDHIVSYVSRFNFIKEIIILADYTGLAVQIKNYFGERKFHGKKIIFVQDSNSGTGGDLDHVSKYVRNDPAFFLWFTDNLCALDLSKMYKFYKTKKSFVTIATRNYRREETGYALVKDGCITEFKEKPEIRLQMSECLGIYVLDTKILKIIKSKKTRTKQINLSFDILQKLSRDKTITAYDICKNPWIDVDSPLRVERNEKMVKKIIRKMKP